MNRIDSFLDGGRKTNSWLCIRVNEPMVNMAPNGHCLLVCPQTSCRLFSGLITLLTVRLSRHKTSLQMTRGPRPDRSTRPTTLWPTELDQFITASVMKIETNYLQPTRSSLAQASSQPARALNKTSWWLSQYGKTRLRNAAEVSWPSDYTNIWGQSD